MESMPRCFSDLAILNESAERTQELFVREQHLLTPIDGSEDSDEILRTLWHVPRNGTEDQRVAIDTHTAHNAPRVADASGAQSNQPQ